MMPDLAHRPKTRFRLADLVWADTHPGHIGVVIAIRVDPAGQQAAVWVKWEDGPEPEVHAPEFLQAVS